MIFGACVCPDAQARRSPRPVSIEITGSSKIVKGETNYYRAYARFSNGRKKDVTNSVRWKVYTRYASAYRGGRVYASPVRKNTRFELHVAYYNQLFTRKLITVVNKPIKLPSKNKKDSFLSNVIDAISNGLEKGKDSFYRGRNPKEKKIHKITVHSVSTAVKSKIVAKESTDAKTMAKYSDKSQENVSKYTKYWGSIPAIANIFGNRITAKNIFGKTRLILYSSFKERGTYNFIYLYPIRLSRIEIRPNITSIKEHTYQDFKVYAIYTNGKEVELTDAKIHSRSRYLIPDSSIKNRIHATEVRYDTRGLLYVPYGGWRYYTSIKVLDAFREQIVERAEKLAGKSYEQSDWGHRPLHFLADVYQINKDFISRFDTPYAVFEFFERGTRFNRRYRRYNRTILIRKEWSIEEIKQKIPLGSVVFYMEPNIGSIQWNDQVSQAKHDIVVDRRAYGDIGIYAGNGKIWNLTNGYIVGLDPMDTLYDGLGGKGVTRQFLYGYVPPEKVRELNSPYWLRRIYPSKEIRSKRPGRADEETDIYVPPPVPPVVVDQDNDGSVSSYGIIIDTLDKLVSFVEDNWNTGHTQEYYFNLTQLSKELAELEANDKASDILLSFGEWRDFPGGESPSVVKIR